MRWGVVLLDKCLRGVSGLGTLGTKHSFMLYSLSSLSSGTKFSIFRGSNAILQSIEATMHLRATKDSGNQAHRA